MPDAPRFEIPYGRGSLSFPLPGEWSVELAEPTTSTPLPDAGAAAREALASPLESPRLRELARGARSATLVITDATRPCPDALFVPLLLEELGAGGLGREAVTVVFALGMHRPTTEAERREKLGPAYGTVAVLDAQGGRRDEYVAHGTLSARELGLPADVPIELHRAVCATDLLVATGLVEPHQYAGFSGGRKTVALGCASAETIGVLHGIPFLEDAGTVLGRLEGNPVHRALETIADRVGLRFVLNVARDAGGRPVAMASGRPAAVLRSLTDTLEPLAWTRVRRPEYDAVIAGVGHPKDDNLYQASRALTYLAFAPRPVLRENGWVVLAAACPEGAGAGPGEAEFLNLMAAAPSPTDALAHMRRVGFGAGGQRAFMVARALERHRAAVVGARDAKPISACHMTPLPDPAAAVELLRRELGERPSVLVVPHGLATLPLFDAHSPG